jgi:hypothetical protein
VAAPSRPELSPTGPSPTRDGVHQNPFLAPEAAGVDHQARRSPWTAIASQLARPARWTIARSPSIHRPQPRAIARPRFRAAPFGRRSAVGAIAAAMAIAASTAVLLTRSGTTQRPVSRSSGVSAPATGRQSSASTVLSDVYALRAIAAHRAAEEARRQPMHHAISTHPRAPRAAKHRTAAAQYVPATSTAGSAAPVSVTPSYSSSAASTPTHLAPPSGGGTGGQTSSTGSRPAFGQNGTLGPGTSPNS